MSQRVFAHGLLVFALAVGQSAFGADPKYQSRGDRWEGIKSDTVSGLGVELLSATVDYSERGDPLGEKFRIRFFLDQPRDDVHLVVRELDNQHYYWLDKARPSSPWKTGYGNVFEWPTAAVIRPLRDLRIGHLGVVARLDSAKAGPEEKVAPAILYQTQPPSEVKGYRFVFKLFTDAKDVKAQVFKQSDLQHPIWTQDLGRRSGQTPIAVNWAADKPRMTPDWYRVVLTGRSLGTGREVVQTVLFYHQPEVQ